MRHREEDTIIIRVEYLLIVMTNALGFFCHSFTLVYKVFAVAHA